ncbi:MAG: tRNA (adenosine(37)-N6)-threonylcarbamoyltransferase complex dimerization subunit type 1 TsaB [Chromatiales bacterium]|nr:tRNA (adenosine(37)-N6)-threonylcarbamoyltransferase complex dimerization subunit type 1 TsaB [Chromatiales bacterium]
MTGESRATNILAVDTATEACSVALSSRAKIYQRFAVAPRRHHSLIFEMCQAVLNDANINIAELDGLVYGRGPGSFTGVRIAASLVQGLAYVHAIPVVAVSDLQAVALQAVEQSDETQVLVAMDARMREIYYGYYQKDGDLVKAIGDEGVVAADKLIVPITFNGIGAGTAWPLYQTELKKVFAERLKKWYAPTLPTAATLLRLAMPQFAANATLSATDALPVYLRHPVSES